MDKTGLYEITIPTWEKYNPPGNCKKPLWFRTNNNMWLDLGLRECSVSARWLYVCLLMRCSSHGANGKFTISYRVAISMLGVSGGLAIGKLLTQLADNKLIILDQKPLSPSLHNKTEHNITKHNKENVEQKTKGKEKVKISKEISLGGKNPPKLTSKSKLKYNDWDQKIVQLILEKVKEINPNYDDSKVNLEKWSNQMRLLRETIKDERKIEDVLNFCYENEFWKGVVQSPSGLRKNWNSLTGQMTNQKNRGIKDVQRSLERQIEDGTFYDDPLPWEIDE